MNGLESKSVDVFLVYLREETDWKETRTAGISEAAEIKANVLI